MAAPAPTLLERENRAIRAARHTPEARHPHRFRAAVYTAGNGHPRCALCGDEEPTSGTCDGSGGLLVKAAHAFGRLVLKAEQLGLRFGDRKPVQRPGSRGGRGYYDDQGHWQYGGRPQPPHPTAAAAATPAALTVEEAEAMGAAARDRGVKSAPALDPLLMPRLAGFTAGESLLPYLTAWSRGWHRRNLSDDAPPFPDAPAPRAPRPFAVGDAVEILDPKDERTWLAGTVDRVGADGWIGVRLPDGRASTRAASGRLRRPGEPAPPRTSGGLSLHVGGGSPAPAPASAATETRPLKAKTFADADHVDAWEVMEPEYARRALERRKRSLAGSIKATEDELARLGSRQGRARHDRELWIRLWQKDLARLEEGDSDALARLRQDAKLEYVKLVKTAISKGRLVPREVVYQSIEFRKALDARLRYEKGRHTSFGNISAGVNASMRAARGYKVKRQDGKPITAGQMAEIARGVSEVEAVLGPLGDLLDASGVTIAHTSGKHPFMRNAGGLYSSGERTISVGTTGCTGRPIPALAHEVGHWLDFESGRKLGREARTYRGGWGKARVVRSTSLAELDDGEYATTNPGRDLIRKATRAINDVRLVERTLKMRLNATESNDQKAIIERAKVSLGPYWRDPCEVVARLIEQFIATKIGAGGFAMDAPDYYATTPGYWMPEIFAELAPEIEREIQRRLAILRAPAQSEAMS